MGAGILLSWFGGWFITGAMALLVHYFSDGEFPWWVAFLGIMAFDFVRWIITTLYAQALWSFFFKSPTIKGLKEALRNERMPKFDDVKDAKQYYEWIFEAGPGDRDKSGNPISVQARVAAARAQGGLDGVFSSGQWIASWRLNSAHDRAISDYLKSPHTGPQRDPTMDEFMEAMNPGSPFNKSTP